jgi:Coenzyme F420 hydrogenase/dehydrogenase, beta subunit C terminus.
LGWDKLTHKVVFSNGKTYYGTFAIDSFMNASMKANCLSRPACYSCKFKGFPRVGDITLGDYWVNGGEKIFSDNTGTSVIIINSKKGKEFLDGINNIKKMKISLESILPGNPALTEPLPKEKINRTDFYDRIENEDFIKVVSSLFPAQELSFKQKLKNILKVIVRELKCSRFNIRSLIQFAYYNFCHPAIKCNLMNGYVFYVAPHCTIEIDKKAIIELNGPLTLGESVFKHSKLETRIKMQKGSKLIIGNLGGNGYGFGYGSDIELFSDATLISKGGPRTNMGTVIICKTKSL